MENLEKNCAIKKQDTGVATLIHLSVFTKYFFPFMGVIAPVLIWKTRNQPDDFIEQNAKNVINFQISTFIYSIVLVFIGFLFFGGTILNYIQLSASNSMSNDFMPLGLFSTLFIGIVIFIFCTILEFVLLILGAIKASNGLVYQYPLTLKILK
ncbi:MAG: DUF4870 domain-containing protein [Flavobacterium sp.]